MMRSGDSSITWRRNPWKVPGAASVDERRCAALSRHLDRFDTERGPAPVDMRVKIDQPRHDEQPAHIDNLGAAGGEVAPDFGYLSVAEGDVGRLVAPARRVDDAAASENQIRHMHASGKIWRWHKTRIRAVREGWQRRCS